MSPRSPGPTSTIRRRLLCVAALLLSSLVGGPAGQAASTPLVMLTDGGRDELSTVRIDGRDMVSLQDLTRAFGIDVQQDQGTNAVRVSYRDGAILLTPGQSLVSVQGRLVSLPGPLVRSGREWFVPIEFIDRALRLIYDQPIELRRASGLLIIGNLRVPRVTMGYEPVDNGIRLVIDLPADIRHAVVEEDGRLLVAIEADAIDEAIPAPPPQQLLSGVNVVGRNTLELELGAAYTMYRTTLAPEPGRVFVDLLTNPPAVAPGGPGNPLPEAPRKASISTLVIDPGHGGQDVGVTGPGGVQEKTVTLAVAQLLRSEIETRFGIRVLLTRSDDRWLDTDARAAYANNNKADLFISLHANASPSPEAAGAEVFYLELDPYADEARRLAQVDGAALPVIGGGTRQIDLVPWELAQAPYVERSTVLAQVMERRLGERVALSPFSLQQGPMRVLVGVNMPAVLIEMGYLSNPGQERELASGAYQSRVVQAVADALVEFRDYLDTVPGIAPASVLPPLQGPAGDGEGPGRANPTTRPFRPAPGRGRGRGPGRAPAGRR